MTAEKGKCISEISLDLEIKLRRFIPGVPKVKDDSFYGFKMSLEVKTLRVQMRHLVSTNLLWFETLEFSHHYVIRGQTR